MAKLTIVYWRDIPSQVIAKQGRTSTKILLSNRFQEAIDRAAMRARKVDSDAYMEDWRRDARTIATEDMEKIVAETAQRFEDDFDDDRLDKLARNKGLSTE